MCVLPAELNPDLMQKIAREFGLAASVFPVRTSDNSYSVRMFSPNNEFTFGGGASMAAAQAMGDGVWMQTSKSAVVRMEVQGDTAWADQPIPDLQPLDDGSIGEAIGLSDVRQSFIGRNLGNIHVLAVTDQHPKDFRPDPARILEVSRRYDGGTVGAVFQQDEQTLVARVFAPSHGLPEDPACGGGAPVIAKAMHEYFGSSSDVTIHSGAELGRPSQMRVRLRGDAAAVGGQIYHLARGFLSLPS